MRRHSTAWRLAIALTALAQPLTNAGEAQPAPSVSPKTAPEHPPPPEPPSAAPRALAGPWFELSAVGADITLRYTGLSYDDPDLESDPDASSVALMLGIHFLF